MIPKKFELHGTDWDVEIDNISTNINNLGECFVPQCKIVIQKTIRGEPVNESMMEATFYHELMHAFLSTGEYQELSENEILVSYLGNCLHQYIQTNVRYESSNTEPKI